ncbi:MAG: hypothetical protein KA155_00420 [Alphaproteobacteria bacterium]|nr:hypothetical protein [Alphaproteobacteria bacterium]
MTTTMVDPRVADIEARGMRLEIIYGADSCRNIDRIARAPGCINWPTADKRDKKGQKPVMAHVVEADFSRVYPLFAFPPHEGRNLAQVIVPSAEIGEETRLQNIDDLDRHGVPARIKQIVLEGRIVDEPKERDNSDSVWLFDGLCGLLRAEVPSGIVLSIIKDPRWGISAHVRKQGRRINEYALRQLQKASAAVSADHDEAWDVDGKGNLKTTYRNTRLAIRRLGIVCEYDTFHNRLKVGGHVLQHYQGELSDNACAMLRQLILEKCGFDPKKDNVRDAALMLCLENHNDPVREYLDSLVWDGVPRLDRLLPEYFGAANTNLNQAIGRLMMIAAVRRVREPGCKFDTIVVLEGQQGTGKSTALTILAGSENFSDQDILALEAKAQMEAVEGVWIYEISELEGMTRSDVGKVKAFVSRQEDRARPAYGRFRENRPRRCIFVGTTNEDQYLRDKTGNRRFLPVKTAKLTLDALRRDRNQLWAEAAHAEAAGESIVLAEALWAEAGILQESRVEYDPWLDRLATIQGQRAGNHDRISTAELLTILEIAPERQNSAVYKRLGYAMRQLGWEGPKTLRLGPGKVQKGFIRPAEYLQAELPHYIEPHPDSAGKGEQEGNDA